MATVFGGDAGLVDRLGAEADLIIGSDFNNKGQKAVKEALGKVTSKVKRIKKARLKKNQKAGNDFEKKVGDKIDGPKASQVTIETADGTKVKMDYVNTKDGIITLTEAKGSSTAPLTKNQRKGFPQIEKTGGTVKGRKSEAIGLPAGTKIPPTKVKVVRPDDF